MSPRELALLERLKDTFGSETGQRKTELLSALSRSRLGRARDVARLHELLCFLRAYPDDARLLNTVDRLLAGFSGRADLRAFRAELSDSGIAGTTILYRFFTAQAIWLAQRWPALLRLDRSDTEADGLIARALPVLLTPLEAASLRERKLGGYEALDLLTGKSRGGLHSTTDACFLLARIAGMPGDSFTRQAFGDAIDASFELRPGTDSPSRTHARFSAAKVHFQRTPLARSRPDLRTEIAHAPRRIRRLPTKQAEEVIELARSAMATRARALDVFSYANSRDAWLADDGKGLAFAFAGVVPERRHPIAAFYGGLTLRNGVPIGYLQGDVVGPTVAVSFNTFETFRGGEAGFTFARLLAALRHVFGCTSFSIEPYQLGQGNDEGLESGAWWFYAKFGFRPRDAAAVQLMRGEAARLARNPRHRSSIDTLKRLARHHVFFDLDPAVRHPLPPLPQLGARVSALLARLSAQLGTDREATLAHCAATATQQCGLSVSKLAPAERAAWRQWAPLMLLLQAERWTSEEQRALAAVIRAKAAVTERTFVMRYLAHPRLHAALMG